MKVDADAPSATVGLISDTHGLLRPEALDALRGSDAIVHAGDVGDPAIIERLSTIAPVTLVRGNVDRGPYADVWPETARLTIAGVSLYVIHDVAALAVDPSREGCAAVIFGHSHKPAIERRGGVVFVNPGSAGPRRFRLPVSVGVLTIDRGRVDARIITLG